jgi:hypothetical protein
VAAFVGLIFLWHNFVVVLGISLSIGGQSPFNTHSLMGSNIPLLEIKLMLVYIILFATRRATRLRKTYEKVLDFCKNIFYKKNGDSTYNTQP